MSGGMVSGVARITDTQQVVETSSSKHYQCYFNHIDQVKRGLRPLAPRPSGPVSPERPEGLHGRRSPRVFDNHGLVGPHSLP